MGWFSDFLFGSYKPVGSASDVTMINQGGYDDYLKRLYGAMEGWGSQMGNYAGAAGAGFGNLASLYGNAANGYNNLASNWNAGGMNMIGAANSAASNAGNQFQRMSDVSGNVENFARSQNNLYGQMSNLTGGFDPNAATNQFLSTNKQLAQLANSNVSNALSDLYSSGRSQAQAAANQARRSAANELASSGLLNSGGAVQAMTKATAQPMMEMETQLAGLRSQALQNQLGQLQNQTGSLLGQGYQNATNVGMQALQNQLSANQLQGSLLGQAGQGMSSLANLYGQTGLGMGQLGQGYGNLNMSALGGMGNAYQGLAGLGELYGNLTGQGYQLGASMNQPYYYTPQYAKTGGLTDLLGSIGTAAAGVGSLLTGIPTGFGNNQSSLGGNNYTYGYGIYQNPWAAGWRSQ